MKNPAGDVSASPADSPNSPRSEEPYLALGPAAEGVPRFGNLEGPGTSPRKAQGDLGA